MKTTKEKIAVMQAFDDGKKIEQMVWNGLPSWMPKENPQWDWAYFDYRVAAEPKLRPWRMEEVPVDCWVRTKQENRAKYRPLVIQLNGVVFAHGDGNNFSPLVLRTFEFLLENTEHSTDNCKTWQPCGALE